MKRIEYPIDEMVSFDMDTKGIWWLKYDFDHEYFPEWFRQVKTRDGCYDKWFNKKKIRDFVSSVKIFCQEQMFTLHGNGLMVDCSGHCVEWNKNDLWIHYLPKMCIPFVLKKGVTIIRIRI